MERNEHLEKRSKDFSVWIEDPCRDCQHKRLFHIFNIEISNPPTSMYIHDGGTGRYVHGNCNFVTLEGFCSCQEWMSSDNLEYIELLAKRKGLIPDDEGEKGNGK